jgi:hypothetical protein
MPRRKRFEPTQFLNVDLDLRSTQDLTSLLEAMKAHAFTLHHEADHARLELRDHPDEVDGTLLGFIAAVEALPPPARALWDQCEERALDIGIQAGATPHSTTFSIAATTVEKLARIGATLCFTVYAPES